MAVAIIAGNFYSATNLHPTDFAHEICIRIGCMRILAGSIASLYRWLMLNMLYQWT